MPRQFFSSFPVLETARLTLRRLKSNDEAAIFLLRSNEVVNKYLDRQPAKSHEDVKRFIASVISSVEQHHSFYWAIVLKGSDKLIGTICLFNQEFPKAEIGFELLPAYHGKGYMLEAASLVVQFAFEETAVTVLEAQTHHENLSSIGLLNRLRFKLKTAVDEPFLLYTLTAESWKKEQVDNGA